MYMYMYYEFSCGIQNCIVRVMSPFFDIIVRYDFFFSRKIHPNIHTHPHREKNKYIYIFQERVNLITLINILNWRMKRSMLFSMSRLQKKKKKKTKDDLHFYG